MSQTAAHLVDHVIPHVPVRQWVLALPIPLRLLLAAQSEPVTPVLQSVQRVLMRYLLRQAGLAADEGHGGAVTLIQRFRSAANLNIHLHCLVLTGVYQCGAARQHSSKHPPSDEQASRRAGADRIEDDHHPADEAAQLLPRRSVLVEDTGQTYLAESDAHDDEARTLRPLQAAAVTYRLAARVGRPRVGS